MKTTYLPLVALLTACAPATGKIETIEEIEQAEIESEDQQESDPTEAPDEQETEDQQETEDEDRRGKVRGAERARASSGSRGGH